MSDIGGVELYRDSAGVLRDRPDDAQLRSLSEKVDTTAAAIPKPATATPRSELTGGATGAQSQRYALEDHQHPRLTSTTYVTLDGTGQALVAFTRTFVNKPGLVPTETDADATAQPIVLRGLTWRRDANGLYTGVTVQGLRARMLPDINPVSGILTAVTTGVNALVAALTRYDIFSTPASGATVSVVAIARSDVPAT